MVTNTAIVKYLNNQNEAIVKLKESLNSETIIRMDAMGETEKKYLKELVKKGLLTQETPKILVDSDWNPNDFLIRQLILNQGIYSAFTALYLWELIDDFPYQIYMTFKMGYKLPKSYGHWINNIKVKQVNKNDLDKDVEELTVQGTKHTIKLYSQERTLVEVLREPYSFNIEKTI